MSIIEKALNKANVEGQSSVRTEISNDVVNTGNEKSFIAQPTKIDKSAPVIETKVEDERRHAEPEMVEINWKQLAELGFVTPGDSNTQTVEEYRNLKRPLVTNAFGENSAGIERGNLILVTSSVPGEGKTFSAINLALSIATERDKKVLLIDADVARPSVSKTLGIKSAPGLIEYLEGQDYKFSDIILNTNMPGLKIIPAGKQHKHSTELLSSNRMVALAKELSERYNDRIVIFDSPPLLAATQGEVLAGLVGQVVLIVEAESTPQSMVMESVSRLSHCDVVLAVLNKTKQSHMDGTYYGYGQYAH